MSDTNNNIISSGQSKPEAKPQIKPEKFESKNFNIYGLNSRSIGTWDQEVFVNAVQKQTVTTPVVKVYATSVPLNVNTATTYNLYRVPNNKHLIVTEVIFRNAVTDTATTSISLGYNDTAYDDLVIDTVIDLLLNTNLYQKVSPGIHIFDGSSTAYGVRIGDPGTILKAKINTPEGSAATLIIDIIGYLI